MATSAVRNDALETIVVGMSETYAVVAACAEGPKGFTRLVDFGSRFDPVEERRPFAVWRGRVLRVRRGVSCSRNFED